MPRPTLYIANKNYSSWSLRPWVLMRHLGLDFEEVLVPFGPESSQAFLRFSPTGKVPCLVDGDVTVWDSLAIVEYLAERHPGVWPADASARAWARCATAEMHSGFGAVRAENPMNCGIRLQLSAPSSALAAQWRRIDALWCEGLRRWGGPFLAGSAFTAVDAFFAPVVFRAQSYAPDLSSTAQGYVERLLTLPALRDWEQAALAEPWRDEPHEAEIAALGPLIQDLRKPAP
jgi:glutathione S-transferase